MTKAESYYKLLTGKRSTHLHTLVYFAAAGIDLSTYPFARNIEQVMFSRDVDTFFINFKETSTSLPYFTQLSSYSGKITIDDTVWHVFTVDSTYMSDLTQMHTGDIIHISNALKDKVKKLSGLSYNKVNPKTKIAETHFYLRCLYENDGIKTLLLDLLNISMPLEKFKVFRPLDNIENVYLN